MRVLVLDDEQEERLDPMCVALSARRLEVVTHRSAPDAIAWLRSHADTVALASLDHDLGPSWLRDGARFEPGTGRDVVEWLCGQAIRFPVMVHSSNSTAAQGMVFRLEEAGWTARRVIPVRTRPWIEEDWSEAIDSLLAARAHSGGR